MFVGYQFGHDSQQVKPDSLLISASTTVLHPLKMTGKCGLNLKYFKKKNNQYTSFAKRSTRGGCGSEVGKPTHAAPASHKHTSPTSNPAP